MAVPPPSLWDGFVRCILCCQTRGPIQRHMRGLVRKDFFFYLRQCIKVFMVRIRVRVGTRIVEKEESCGRKTCAGMAAPGPRQQVDAIAPETRGASFIWVQIRDWEKPILVLNSHFSSSSMVPIHLLLFWTCTPVSRHFQSEQTERGLYKSLEHRMKCGPRNWNMFLPSLPSAWVLCTLYPWKCVHVVKKLIGFIVFPFPLRFWGICFIRDLLHHSWAYERYWSLSLVCSF